MMFRLVNRLLSFLQHIHNHRFYVFSVYTICLFYEIFFSLHIIFFTTAAWKKNRMRTLFFVWLCVYMSMSGHSMWCAFYGFSYDTYCSHIFHLLWFFSLLLTFSPYFVSFASYSCMFVHFIILHVLEHSYALIL